MKREVSYKKIKDYLEGLVEKTDYIKGFVGSSRTELANKLSSRSKLEDPFLVFFGYGGRLEGNNKQRTLGSRNLSFSILFRCKADNYLAQENAYDLGEIYGLNLIARIHWEATHQQHKWLARVFDKDNVEWGNVEYETANGLFGCEFSFSLPTKDPLVVDSDFWNDRNDFCNYP